MNPNSLLFSERERESHRSPVVRGGGLVWWCDGAGLTFSAGASH